MNDRQYNDSDASGQIRDQEQQQQRKSKAIGCSLRSQPHPEKSLSDRLDEIADDCRETAALNGVDSAEGQHWVRLAVELEAIAGILNSTAPDAMHPQYEWGFKAGVAFNAAHQLFPRQP